MSSIHLEQQLQRWYAVGHCIRGHGRGAGGQPCLSKWGSCIIDGFGIISFDILFLTRAKTG